MTALARSCKGRDGLLQAGGWVGPEVAGVADSAPSEGLCGYDELEERICDRATAKPLGSNKALGLVSDGVVTLEVCYDGVIRGMISLCDGK